MKSITTLALLTLIGIIGSLFALNYYVNFYKPQKQAVVTSELSVVPSVGLPKDTVKMVPDTVSSVKTTIPQVVSPVVPTSSTTAKSSTPAKTVTKQTAHAPTTVPKSADVAVVPSAKPVLPAKIVPKTVAPDAGITTKGGDAIVATEWTKGLHYVVIGSFTDENNAKVAMKNYPLKNLSIHKDGKFYRLSAGAFATTVDAKRRMNELQRQSVESMMIQH
jgi:cytoskeletal protein RodZ